MKEELKQAWIADLKANPNLKGTGQLRSDAGSYCCLGRLLVVAGKPGEIDDLQADGQEELTMDLLDELGLDLSDQTRLIDINDEGPDDEGAETDWYSVIQYIEKNL